MKFIIIQILLAFCYLPCLGLEYFSKLLLLFQHLITDFPILLDSWVRLG